MNSLLLIVILTVGVLHGCQNYVAHKSVAQAIANGLEWAFGTYFVGMVLLIGFVLLALHFCWFGSC